MQVPNGARPRDARSTEASGPQLSLTPSATPALQHSAVDESDVDASGREPFDEGCELEAQGPRPRELEQQDAHAANGSAAPPATPDVSAAPEPGDDLPACWERIQAEVQSRVKKEQFETWFRRAALRDAIDGTLAIAVQNTFARDWLNGNYREQIGQAVHAVLGTDWSFELVVDPELTVMTSARAQARSAEPEPAPAEPSKPAAPASAFAPTTPAGSKQLLWASDVVLNPQYRFDNFVVGPCNRFAHAAALGVSEMPGSAYNPFFLHGSVGLGKTHLLQSMCFSLLERVPETRILYLSCETFINHFIGALENGDLHKFRGKYRNVDVLVVDDIHLLANKDRTQEEFFHTFNTLYNAGKQIVLSSDSPPKEIPTLQDRLVSRFKWGLVSEIEQPCYETRNIAAVQGRRGLADGDLAIVQEGAVGRQIDHHDMAVVILDHAMGLGDQPVGIGQHDIVVVAAPDGHRDAAHDNGLAAARHRSGGLKAQSDRHRVPIRRRG
jgi:chromosomal replication initiation ATPase DnaA